MLAAMNNDVPDDDASVVYYDGDYPSLETGGARAGDAALLARLGMLGDVGHYLAVARRTGGPVLDIGCGTGRVAIPLARAGVSVWAVDVSAGMLARLEARLAREPPGVRQRVQPVRQDAAGLDLPERGFALAILPFNVLMLIPHLTAQRATLAAAAAHLAPGGELALDVMNPLTQDPGAQTRAVTATPRASPHTGNPYIRHDLCGPMDADQRQRLYGWCEELLPDGRSTVTDFSFHWRLIFRDELDAMLNEAGFTVTAVTGDFGGAPWTAGSGRIVVTAVKTP
jgi:SAM-dependent methyltransferase